MVRLIIVALAGVEQNILLLAYQLITLAVVAVALVTKEQHQALAALAVVVMVD